MFIKKIKTNTQVARLNYTRAGPYKTKLAQMTVWEWVRRLDFRTLRAEYTILEKNWGWF